MRIYSFEDAYRFLGIEGESSHPGHPNEPTSHIPSESVPFDVDSPQSYLGGSGYSQAELSVADISRRLYPLVPSLERRAGAHHTIWAYKSSELYGKLNAEASASDYDCLKQCVSLVCHCLSQASNLLHSAMPVRVGFDYNEPHTNAPPQWATVLSFLDGRQVILPLSLDLRSPRSINGANTDRLLLQGWTIDYAALRWKRSRKSTRVPKFFYQELTKVLSDFKDSAVLHITDVDMLFLTKSTEVKWRPRRFATAWTLYDTILHASSSRKYPIARVRGLYTSLSILLDEVYACASQVKFAENFRLQPFQLLRPGEFTIISGPGCSSDIDEFLNTLLAYNSPETSDPEEDQMANEPLDIEMEDLFDENLDGDLDPHCDEFADGEACESGLTEIGESPGTYHMALDSNIPNQSLNATKGNRKDLNRLIMCHLRLMATEVDGKPMCGWKSCPLPRSPRSKYCKYHSEGLTQILLKHAGQGQQIQPSKPGVQWELRSTAEHKVALKLLKGYLVDSPHENWIIDCEFITVKGNGSTPIQLSIRQMNGSSLLETTVDYGISLPRMLEKVQQISKYPLGPMVSRVYGSSHTHGMKPSEIRKHVLDVLGYSPKRVQLFSWFATHDWKCFHKLLTGSDEFLPPTEPDLEQPGQNFNPVNIGYLLRSMLPPGFCMKLEVVHSILLESRGQEQNFQYHNASHDTLAVSDIVKAMTELV